MLKNILLVEPAYPTKFPPMGLMKISTYHKQLDPNVNIKFVKGIDEDVRYADHTWDRVYISTVFTFNWKITVRTIEYYKNAVVNGDPSKIFVGGILATLMQKELFVATGVKPIANLLDKPGILDKGNQINIDKQIPDYSLFNDCSHKYDLIDDSYFGYSTRGCPRGCDFCGVNILEPKFKDYRGIKTYINTIKQKHGEKAHLVLFDNNILASKKLDKVVSDLLDLGFEKGAKFSYRNKQGRIIYKERHVDFNQGIDARYLSEDKIALLSQIAIHPLRIAFDHIRFQKLYSEKIELAAKYDIKNLSNYILYNHNDTPEDLWNRLKINIDLNKKHDLRIYSFPMKYIPLNAKDRSHIDKSWNWQFVRGVQRILNVVKGIVMPGEDFFYRAFGNSAEEFVEILYMPEWIIMERGREEKDTEKLWKKSFQRLSGSQKKQLLDFIIPLHGKIRDRNLVAKVRNTKLKNALEFYIEPNTPQAHPELF